MRVWSWPSGGVAAGTEAAGITEVLKSERAGRHLPLKEDRIIASAELVAEQGITEDGVRSHLGDAGLFEAYAETFAAGIGRSSCRPFRRLYLNGEIFLFARTHSRGIKIL